MNKKSQTYLAKNLFLYFITSCIFQFSNAQESADEDLPFNAIIQSTLKGKRYKFYGNKTSVRKQIGMAVPPLAAKAIFSSIKKCLC